MVAKKARIVIIGAGMAGVTAANKLYTATGFKDLFELFVVEGGSRIGGRINTSEFGGDRIEMGATWIDLEGYHGSYDNNAGKQLAMVPKMVKSSPMIARLSCLFASLKVSGGPVTRRLPVPEPRAC